CEPQTTSSPPHAHGGLLVVCGSHVPTSTRQLRTLVEAYPDSLVEVDALELAGGDAGAEIGRATAEASSRLSHGGLAVVATPRERLAAVGSWQAGQRLARNLARVAGAVEPPPEAVLAKGGITAAVTAHVGLAARSARVV